MLLDYFLLVFVLFVVYLILKLRIVLNGSFCFEIFYRYGYFFDIGCLKYIMVNCFLLGMF